MTEIIIACVTSVTTLLGVVVVAWQHIKLKRIELEVKESAKTAKIEAVPMAPTSVPMNAGEVVSDFARFNELARTVSDVFDNTSAVRFTLFFAVNGKEAVNTVHLMYSEHKDTNHTGVSDSFLEVSSDHHYKDLLKQIEAEGAVRVDVTRLTGCVLKALSLREGIMHEDFHFITRKSLSESADMLLFCSFASTSAKEPPPTDRAYITAKMGVIKRMVGGVVSKIR